MLEIIYQKVVYCMAFFLFVLFHYFHCAFEKSAEPSNLTLCVISQITLISHFFLQKNKELY